MASSAQLEHPLSSELLLSAVSAIEECQTMCVYVWTQNKTCFTLLQI